MHRCHCKYQAIQGDDIPAETTSLCVNFEGNPFQDTTWLAFEGAACSHASTSEHPNPPAPEFQRLPNFMTL
eukprot:1156779-Pelagomonas_calceolata.AAC.6